MSNLFVAHRFSPRLRADFAAAEQRRRTRVPAPRDLESGQLEGVRTMWSDAVNDVPYYSALVRDGLAPRVIRSWDDLRAVPILLRSHLQDQPEAFVRRSHRPEKFIYTAGSTGTPIRIGSDAAESRLLRIVKLASWQEFGYQPGSRLFLFWAHTHLLGSGWRRLLNSAVRATTDRYLGYRRLNAFQLDRHRCEAIAEELIKFKPSGLIGYSAALDLFGRYTAHYRERFRKLSLSFVLSTTEAPPRPDSVANLTDLFGCPVVQEYGGADFGQVAFKKDSEPFEVYSDLSYVEAEPLESEPDVHPLLVTTLYPRYVPLFRYRVGDGVTGAEVLAHGHVARFCGVAGRLTDVVDLGGGESIHSLAIHHCVHSEPGVYNIQMRLHDHGIECRLVVAPDTDRPSLEARTRRRLGLLHPALGRAQFTYAEDVATSRAGKRRWCIDERTVVPSCAE